MFDVSLV